ncbi:MAG: hypothetical protein J6Y56_06855 [Fibrobacterales bacterium]|nr:hypothetical protein [Fibrobacterales bacterium]
MNVELKEGIQNLLEWGRKIDPNDPQSSCDVERFMKRYTYYMLELGLFYVNPKITRDPDGKISSTSRDNFEEAKKNLGNAIECANCEEQERVIQETRRRRKEISERRWKEVKRIGVIAGIIAVILEVVQSLVSCGEKYVGKNNMVEDVGVTQQVNSSAREDAPRDSLADTAKSIASPKGMQDSLQEKTKAANALQAEGVRE